MTIEITDREKEILGELFEAAERELIAGIDHADTREFRRKLKDRLRVMEALRAKIGAEQRSSDLIH
jgi:hypothetical protein